jgi:2,3-bisphosphoglycerate-independent phosphoglycerate mutase
MKYVLIIPDGCADQPQDSLGGRTPLQAARLPAMDRVAARGVVGAANHVPPHLPPGSDVANLSLLGYDPNRFFSGRAPLEAAAQGIELGPHDWAVRCNLVCIQDQVMKDFTAGHISTAEATALLETANAQLQDARIRFVPGVSYRNLMIVRGSDQQPPPFSLETSSTPPHDLTDQSVADAYPQGIGSDLLCQLMNDSLQWFDNHPVNQQRLAAGKLPATNIWLWGLGHQPNLTSFHSRFGIQGVMITAVDLLRGLAKLVGWDLIEVPTATGYIDTDFAGKGRATFRSSAAPASPIAEDSRRRAQGDPRPAGRESGRDGRQRDGQADRRSGRPGPCRSTRNRRPARWTCSSRPASRSAWR